MGELLGVLALNGLFVLMAQHGLEYPQFYVRLYGAISPEKSHHCRETESGRFQCRATPQPCGPYSSERPRGDTATAAVRA